MNNAKEIAEKILNCNLTPPTWDEIENLAHAYNELNEKYDKVLSYTSESLDIDTAFTIVSTNDEITKLKKSRDVLRKALAFYGDKENYESIDKSLTTGNKVYDIVLFDFDRNFENKKDYAGKKAREAIKADDDIMKG